MDVVALLPWKIAPVLATALLHSLWQCTLLALVAAIALAALSQRNAATRHTVAMGILTAMVLVPIATVVRLLREPTTSQASGWLPALTPPELDAATGQFVQQSDPVAAVLALLWLCGVGVMLLRRFGGWRMLAALDRQQCIALPAEWQQRFDTLRAAMGVTRRVAVRLSNDVVGPFTARLLRPVIWLPLSLLVQLPREQVEALLAHELAHIARMDWLWNGLQCVLESLLFFHPAAWWLGRRIRQEREHACDDRAVAVCGDAIALAEALEQLERHRHLTPRLVLAAQGGSLMKRITRLLAAPPARARWGAAIGTGALVVSGVLLFTQVGVAHHGRNGIHITSTTNGKLAPGDSRNHRLRQGWMAPLHRDRGQRRQGDRNTRSGRQARAGDRRNPALGRGHPARKHAASAAACSARAACPARTTPAAGHPRPRDVQAPDAASRRRSRRGGQAGQPDRGRIA